jgi:hypothetical protein
MDDNFLSIDKLVEFGLSVAVAQQMVKTMNHSMTSMHIPGVMNPMAPASPSIYYAIIDGKQVGPLSDQEISRLINEKKISKETYVWKPGMARWEISGNLPDVLKLVALSPPPFDVKG